MRYLLGTQKWIKFVRDRSHSYSSILKPTLLPDKSFDIGRMFQILVLDLNRYGADSSNVDDIEIFQLRATPICVTRRKFASISIFVLTLHVIEKFTTDAITFPKKQL